MKDGIYLRGAVYWIQYSARAQHRCVKPGPRVKHPCTDDCPQRGRVELRVFRESAGRTRAEAKAKLADKRSASARGSLVPEARRITLEDLERLARDRYVADGRRATKRIAQAFVHLRAGLPEGAIDVTTSAVTAHEARRLAGGAARATVNYELACLRRAFNLAVEAGILATKPVIKTPNPNNARAGVFEERELRAVMTKLPAWARPVAEFLWLTGWRVSEALALTWRDNVDWKARLVRIVPGVTKGGEGRQFPFGSYPPLKTLLEGQLASGEPVSAARVFHKEGRPVPYRALNKAWRAACRAAKCPGRLMHDLRRTAASDFRRAGVSEGEIMKLCGWRTRAMFDRYDIIDERDREAAVARRAATISVAAGLRDDSI